MVHERPRADIGALSNGDRGDERGIRSHEDAVADGGAVLGLTVIVAGHGSGPDVHRRAHIAVEDRGEVANASPGSNRAVLDLGMRPQLYPGREHGIRTNSAVGAYPDVVPELTLLQVGGADHHPVPGSAPGEGR